MRFLRKKPTAIRCRQQHWDEREIHIVVIEAEGHDLTLLQAIDVELGKDTAAVRRSEA